VLKQIGQITILQSAESGIVELHFDGAMPKGSAIAIVLPTDATSDDTRIIGITAGITRTFHENTSERSDKNNFVFVTLLGDRDYTLIGEAKTIVVHRKEVAEEPAPE
jgi:hypothetical protein